MGAYLAMSVRPLVAMVSIVVLSGHVHGQTLGDPEAGHRLATRWCSECHRVEPGVPGTASDAVPSFSSIGQQSSTTALAIRAFLRTSHPVMPNFNLSDPQIDDISAYILSLRAPRSR